MAQNETPVAFSKKEVRLPDGRRLIYYDFKTPNPETPQIQPQKRKEQ